MGLRDAIKAAVSAAYNAVGDIKTAIVYTSRTETYTPATGTVSLSDTTINCDAIILPPGPIKKSIMQNQDVIPVDSNETRAMIKADDLATIAPKIGDLIVIDSIEWLVNEISWDPSSSIFIFKIKRP